MSQSATKKPGKMVILLNKFKTYFSKPQNIILLLFGIGAVSGMLLDLFGIASIL